MSTEKGPNFIEELIAADVASGKHNGRVLTRFPPEPNGYLHIGHAKSICLNFGVAKKFNGKTNLRFDDTNPETEETEYVESIKADIKWLGFDWANEFYTSDYFDTLFEFAIKLIKNGWAYVDDSTSEQIAEMKGTPTEPGNESPFRNRTIEENISLFEKMKNGEFKEGEKVLRAKIDMASPNMHMRDPVIYRIKHAAHHRTGNKWLIYPMYDFAHGQSDSIENITHSICTLEFEVHRPLYEWLIEKLDIFPSRQYEFARLNLSYTVMSKRKLLQLVKEKHVDGWDDPRMPTLSGLRRRGYTPASIRNFCDIIGVAKRENVIDAGLLEFCVREDLNKHALRRMVVLNPVKLIITDYPDGKTETFHAENNPEAEDKGGYRQITFSKEIWIEREDFMENPPKKFFRLAPGQMVRLKNAYIIKCHSFKKDDNGNITEIYCSHIPESRSGKDSSGINVKGTLHWVDAGNCTSVEVRLYDRLFRSENPGGANDFTNDLNPDSCRIIHHAMAEYALTEAQPVEHYQFLRLGYFFADKNSTAEKQIFNRTVTLKDTWAKELKKKE
ncbi:MAG: glutamine--tRNA ligase/YqeY domain fusion protein [Bacteroidia bacterium]|nr:glutamine--tRNA ligase/YqeY domain fusion protein [Bacteroidia bacterium]MCZ2278451.1 glutamine--tRNA ligase/YqeY domain fusion protein [Bacteroidia bacterium]